MRRVQGKSAMADSTATSGPFGSAVPRREAAAIDVAALRGRLAMVLGVALPPALFLVALIALWAVLSSIGWIPSYILPSPGAIANEFASNYNVLVKHALATTREALSGFLLGNILAIAMASLLTCSPVLKDTFFPYALISRAIPIIVFTPLVVVLLGRGFPPILAIVSFSVYFPTFLNMMRGLNSVDLDYEELLHTLSASRAQRLRMIQFPASMPFLFAALKVSASGAFISALVTEWIGSNVGLGYLVVVSSQYFKLPTMWAAIFTAAMLTLVLLGLVTLLERLLGRWTATAKELGT
jgi:NitT/TauT family transport system permease protein